MQNTELAQVVVLLPWEPCDISDRETLLWTLSDIIIMSHKKHKVGTQYIRTPGAYARAPHWECTLWLGNRREGRLTAAESNSMGQAQMETIRGKS